MKKISLYASAFLVLLAVAGGISSYVARASTSAPLTGWGWSDNIGWLSFSCTTGGSTGNNICATSNYGVMEDGSGNLSGYAWSDNIGWVYFGSITGYPNSTYGTSPKINTTTGAVTGWALACAGTVNGDCTGGARTDGWDGWISLSGMTTGGSPSAYGLSYASSNGTFSGYAWGSDVIGWLSLNTSTSTPPTNPLNCIPATGQVCGGLALTTGTVALTVSPSTIKTGQTAILSWTTQNVTTCSITSSPANSFGTSGWTGTVNSTSTGSGTVGTFPSPLTVAYTMVCNVSAANGGGTVFGQTTLTINTTGSSTPANSLCTPVVNATMCSGEGSTTPLSSTTVVPAGQCTTGAPAASLCEYYCNTGFRQVGTGASARCVLNSTIQEN